MHGFGQQKNANKVYLSCDLNAELAHWPLIVLSKWQRLTRASDRSLSQPL